MKVYDLIAYLTILPQDKDVLVFYDGAERGKIDGIVNEKDSCNVILVADWSIYRDGKYRAYEEDDLIFSEVGDEKDK